MLSRLAVMKSMWSQTRIGRPDDPQLRHVSVVGDTYMILVPGAQTAGRFCLIDMLVPDGSGPPPHRHRSSTRILSHLSIRVGGHYV